MHQQHHGPGDNIARDKINSQVNVDGNYIENQIIQYGDKRIKQFLTQPPFQAEYFVGRDDDLKKIHEQLFHGNNLLLLVNGQGGVGKTSVASRYFHKYHQHYTHLAWLLRENNITNALLRLEQPLGLNFSPEKTTDRKLEELLQTMANLNAPCLLILDNVNEISDLDDHYLKLRQLNKFRILLTTRINEYAQAAIYPIEGLPEDEALDLFEEYYRPLQVDEKNIFYQIRDAVGKNTLVVELLAKNLKITNRIRKKYALADLLKDLQKKNLLQLTYSKEVTATYQGKGTLRREKPEDIIAAMYVT